MSKNKDNSVQKDTSFMKTMVLFVWAHIPVILTFELVLGLKSDIMMSAILLAILTGASTLAYMFMRNNPIGEDIVAISVVGLPAVLVFGLSGHEWQVDAHMYFFATLALIIGFKSYRTLLFAAGAIAVHHLSLNFTLPSLLFPGGADFVRVVFHAVIVVVETAILLQIIRAGKATDKAVAGHLADSQAALEAAKRAEAEKVEVERRQEADRQEAMRKMADAFDERVGKIVMAVETAASELHTRAGALSETIRHASDESTTVARSSTDAAQNVETVSAAAEELTASIQEISRNISDTSDTAKRCAADAKISQDKLTHLSHAIEEIDSVIVAINEVAEQTNLLALNATIESARAGEAGKGFAVVANEVKSLANETHKMTEDISNKVMLVKQSAGETVASIDNILKQISDVEQKTSDVASAVSEQNNATKEISQNVTRASQGTEAVSKSIKDVQDANNESADSTEKLKESADHLAGQATDLKSAVDAFLSEIRGAA
jgi:methyl-accepting chemotaxis protein